MLLLQGVAVAYYAPSFGGKEGLLEGVIAEFTEIYLLFEVPKTGGVVFETLQTVWLILEHLLVVFFCLRILSHFEVTFSYLTKYPASLVLLLWQLSKDFDGLGALIQA